MFSSKLTSFVTLAASVASIVSAAPTVDLRAVPGADGMSPMARSILERSSPAAPHFVVYSDKATGTADGSPPPSSSISGWNVFAIAFLLLEGAWDNAEVWTTLAASERQSILTDYHSNGISLIVSAFGSTDIPTSSGADPATTASTFANWVVQYGLDGIDVDYEDFAAIEDSGSGPAWLATFTSTLRETLPVGQYILTHAPVAPWFSPGLYPNNAYLAVDQAVGNLIDWYNIQFYNQFSDYTTCDGLLTTSSTTFPNSALFQIAASGVSLDKLVIGKPGTTADQSNGGYIDPGTLATCVQQAQSQGWNAGVMAWEYPDANSAWITTVRADSWPVGSGGVSSIAPPSSVSTTAPPTTSPTSTISTSSISATTTGTVTCATASAWTAADAYPAGSMVVYNGSLYTATQWNEDEAPGGPSGAWQLTGSCGSLASVASKISLSAAVASAAQATITKA